MNIYLYYIFEIGLLALVVMAVVYAFKEATRPDPGDGPQNEHESPED